MGFWTGSSDPGSYSKYQNKARQVVTVGNFTPEMREKWGGLEGREVTLDEIKQLGLEEFIIPGSTRLDFSSERSLYQTAGMMGNLALQLRDQAEGKAPSLAQMQADRSMNKIYGQSSALANSVRGMNPAMASRNAMMAYAQAGGDIAGQTQMNAIKERLAAQQGLAETLRAQAGIYGGLEQMRNQRWLGEKGMSAQSSGGFLGNALGSVMDFGASLGASYAGGGMGK